MPEIMFIPIGFDWKEEKKHEHCDHIYEAYCKCCTEECETE